MQRLDTVKRVKYPSVVVKQLQCLKCGTKREILRKSSKNKKIGHIKTMLCITCKKKTDHIELGEI